MVTTGTLVMCLIQVVTFNSFIVQTQAEGKVKSSKITSKMAIVDFSKQAKTDKWQGDYSKTLVEADKCVEVE